MQKIRPDMDIGKNIQAIRYQNKLTQDQVIAKLNDHRLKAGGLFRAEAQTLRLKVALGAKAPSFPD